MAANINHSLTTWPHHGGQIIDVSEASVAYTAAPFQGRLVNAWVCISAAITGSDSIITIKKKVGSATAVTLGTVTCVVASSAPGSTFQMLVTGSEVDCAFNAGDTLQFDCAGQSSTTAIGTCTAIFKGM